jgi:hypothetical protein
MMLGTQAGYSAPRGVAGMVVVFEIICPILVGDMCHNA